MTPNERARAVRAVKERLNDLGWTDNQLCARAGIDPKTLRTFLGQQSWPRAKTLNAISAALGWSPGEIQRRCRAGAVSPAVRADGPLDAFTTEEILTELLRRNAAWLADPTVHNARGGRIRELRADLRQVPRNG